MEPEFTKTLFSESDLQKSRGDLIHFKLHSGDENPTVNLNKKGNVGLGTSFSRVSGGFGAWELAFPVFAIPVTYRGLRSYRFIGVAWLMHSAWDIAHQLWGHSLWPFMPTASFGCMICDALIAVWFFAGAPSLFSKEQVVLEAKA